MHWMRRDRAVCPVDARAEAGMRHRVQAAVAICLLMCHGMAAGDQFSVDANVRTMNTAVFGYDNPALFGTHDVDLVSATALRLVLKGNLSEWLTWEAHPVQSLDYASLAAVSRSDFLRYRVDTARWRWSDGKDYSADLFLDRLYLRMSFPGADLTIGRQAVSFGETYFWNPMDIFLPFDARQVDRDYKQGVDAVRLDVPLGQFAGACLVGALGRESADDGIAWGGSALIANVFVNRWGWQWSAEGGKVYGGYLAGIGASGEAGSIAVRGSATYTLVDRDDPSPGASTGDHVDAVLGMGRAFDNSLTVALEYYFNRSAMSDDLNAAWLSVAGGDSTQTSRHLLGFLVGYDLMADIKGSAILLHSFSDGSSGLQPWLTISAGEELELIFGGFIAMGRRPDHETLAPRSEFGTFPSAAYIELKYYF